MAALFNIRIGPILQALSAFFEDEEKGRRPRPFLSR